MPSSFMTGVGQASGQIPRDVLMGMELNRREANDQATLKLAQEEGQRKQLAFEHAEKQRVEQEKIDNAYTPVSLVAPNLLKMPKTRQQMVDAAKSAGFDVKEMDDDIYVQNKGIKHIGGLFNTQVEFKKMMFNNMLTDLQEQNAGLGTQIAELTEKGAAPDDKKLAPLVQQQTALKKQIASLITSQSDIAGKIAVAEVKQKEWSEPYETTVGGRKMLIQKSDKGEIKRVGQDVSVTVKPSSEKEPTGADKKLLLDMVDKATDSGSKEPSSNSITLINDVAGRLGYEYVKNESEKPGLLWGTNKSISWDLVPKGAGGQTAQPTSKTVTIDGKKYKDGDIVTQNGKQFKVKVK